jgi:hypothetical protein
MANNPLYPGDWREIGPAAAALAELRGVTPDVALEAICIAAFSDCKIEKRLVDTSGVYRQVSVADRSSGTHAVFAAGALIAQSRALAHQLAIGRKSADVAGFPAQQWRCEMDPEPVAYSLDDITALGGPGKTKLYGEINSGKLIAHKCGRKTIVLPPDLKQYLERLPTYDAKPAAPCDHREREQVRERSRKRRRRICWCGRWRHRGRACPQRSGPRRCFSFGAWPLQHSGNRLIP